MSLNIVFSYPQSQMFKSSRYFRQNLGLVTTVESNGRRGMNKNDPFSYFYLTQYKTTIYAQGNVGDIKFYIDHGIKDNTFAIYTGDTFEEFLYTFDYSYIKGKGIDNYLGFLLKDVDLKYEEMVKNNELKKLEIQQEGDPEAIFRNPGNVTYADFKAYLEKKQKERYKNNNML